MTAEKTENTTSKKKREAPISYRPPVALREEFCERVARSGLSTSAFITSQIFANRPSRQSRRASPQERDIVRVLALLASVTDDIKSGNADRAEMHAKLAEARTTLMTIMGRQT